MSETNKPAGDERLVKSAASSSARADRASSDEKRINQEGTALSLEERRQRLRSEWQQEVLPTPPKLPGFHTCWLSTTNSSDPIFKRIQKGYELVRINEVPGFSQHKVDAGEFEGCVACNEMILAKIPEELYQDLMAYFHHELPMEEEEMLRANAAKSEVDSNGRELGEIEGFDSLARRVKVPTYQ